MRWAEVEEQKWKAPDYSELKEKDFNRMLEEINDLVELESVANRRKHLNAPQYSGESMSSAMNEEMLRRRMMEFERKRARLGFSTMLPDDKRRRIWREPLTKNELHVVTFMREHGTISAEDLAGAMDEELQEMRRVLLRLIDRQYVKVVSERGYAKYRARTKDELQDDLE